MFINKQRRLMKNSIFEFFNVNFRSLSLKCRSLLKFNKIVENQDFNRNKDDF